MRLKLQERESGPVTILELEGQLILGPEVDALRRAIQKLLKARKAKIVLHLGKLERLDSVGVGTMIDAVKSARRAGGDIRLLALSKNAQGVLTLLGLTRRPEWVRIFAQEQEALDSFQVTAPR